MRKVLWLFIVLVFCSFANAGLNFSENFNDGNFDGWNFEAHVDAGTWSCEVTNGFLNITKVNGAGYGDGIFIQKDLDIDVTSETRISFDINPVFSDVAYGSGYYNDEYPASIYLELETASGLSGLRFAYNYRGGSDIYRSNSIIIAKGDALQNTWLLGEEFRILDYFPDASKITSIKLMSNGWDFTGQFDNIQIVPEPATLLLLGLGGLILRKKK